MENKVPEAVEKEFTTALDQHEQDLRKGLGKHLDHIEKHEIPHGSEHHIDATEGQPDQTGKGKDSAK
jgi:hypothetical protein